MELKEFFVPSMHCEHCVHTIEMELSEFPGVTKVEAHMGTSKVEITYDKPATIKGISEQLIEIGYPPETENG